MRVYFILEIKKRFADAKRQLKGLHFRQYLVVINWGKIFLL